MNQDITVQGERYVYGGTIMHCKDHFLTLFLHDGQCWIAGVNRRSRAYPFGTPPLTIPESFRGVQWNPVIHIYFMVRLSRGEGDDELGHEVNQEIYEEI